MTNASPLVRFQDVSKKFPNGALALRDLDLQISRGSFVSLLGPSGCGKSTLLRMMADLAPVSTGKIKWDTEGAGRTGFVFQDPTLMPWASVSDNVALPLKLQGGGGPAATERVMQALSEVGLADVAGSFPHELSGGMKMRVSIARSLVLRPALLLMDEPFAALDEMTRRKLNDDVLRLWQDHDLTVVFVTHNVYEAVYLSSRVLVMAARPGRIIGDMAIEAAHPRGEGFRHSTTFAELCREVSSRLEQTL